MDHQHDGRRMGMLLRTPLLLFQRQISLGLARAGYDDLRTAHMPIFIHLDHPPGGTRVTLLAERAQVTKQTMGELVAYLVAHGYLELIPDPSDRRAKLARFTARGWQAHETTPRIADEVEADWIERLGRERFDRLRGLLAQLIDALGHDPSG